MESTCFKFLIVCSLGCIAFAAVCKDPIDIVVVVDGSQSIGETPFQTLKTNLGKFGEQLSVSDTGVKVGIVLYSTDVDESGLIPITGSATSLARRTAGLPYPEGGTYTNKGIDEAVVMFTTYGRRNVPRIMVVITDGFSDRPESTKTSAVKARNSQISVYALGVGAGVSSEELNNIASSRENVLNAGDFNVLIKTLTDLTQSICASTTSRATTPPTSRTVVRPPVTPLTPGVCDDCDMENGVGYKAHPTNCMMFIQCVVMSGKIDAHEKHCAESLFWNHKMKTCVNFYDSDCYKDECENGKTFLYPSLTNCGLYFNCTNLKISRHCCDGATPKFDAVTKTCIASSDCQQCSFKSEEERQAPGACDNSTYRPHYNEDGTMDPCKYDVHVGSFVTPLPCGLGTNFNPARCDCSLFATEPCSSSVTSAPSARVGGTQGTCNADLHIPFDNNQLKDEVNSAWIGNKGVRIFDDAAIFTGQNAKRLFINRYSNIDFTLPLAIKVVFKETESKSDMAVLSTGGCIDKPAIYITAGNGRLTLGVVTESQGYDKPATTSATMSGTNTWKEVIYLFDGSTLSGQVTNLDDNLRPASSPVEITPVSVPTQDRIKIVEGAFQLGYAHDNGFPGFIGTITELTIWKGCKDLLTVSQYSALSTE